MTPCLVSFGFQPAQARALRAAAVRIVFSLCWDGYVKTMPASPSQAQARKSESPRSTPSRAPVPSTYLRSARGRTDELLISRSRAQAI
eukprot:scaffold8414_cov103-Skeletonema_marinoi.AAC.2